LKYGIYLFIYLFFSFGNSQPPKALYFQVFNFSIALFVGELSPVRKKAIVKPLVISQSLGNLVGW
jgi:hypothetical protein